MIGVKSMLFRNQGYKWRVCQTNKIMAVKLSSQNKKVKAMMKKDRRVVAQEAQVVDFHMLLCEIITIKTENIIFNFFVF